MTTYEHQILVQPRLTLHGSKILACVGISNQGNIHRDESDADRIGGHLPWSCGHSRVAAKAEHQNNKDAFQNESIHKRMKCNQFVISPYKMRNINLKLSRLFYMLLKSRFHSRLLPDFSWNRARLALDLLTLIVDCDLHRIFAIFPTLTCATTSRHV